MILHAAACPIAGSLRHPPVHTFAGMADTATPSRVPLVDYLVLDDGDPHLVATGCTNCGARFFDRRNACASCFGTDGHGTEAIGFAFEPA